MCCFQISIQDFSNFVTMTSSLLALFSCKKNIRSVFVTFSFFIFFFLIQNFADASYYRHKMKLNETGFLCYRSQSDGIILGSASDTLILKLQRYAPVFFFKFVWKKGLPGTKDLACSVLQHKGNLSWKHNQYLSPPAWQSKVQPWLRSLAVSFVRECGVPKELIKTGNV